MEHILQPGDPCRECQRLGLTKLLRYFHINLEEKILKCESNQCIFPYEIDDDEENNASNEEQSFTITELKAPSNDANRCDNYGMQFIEELLNDTEHPMQPNFEVHSATSSAFNLKSNKLIKKEEPYTESSSATTKNESLQNVVTPKIEDLKNIKMEKNIDLPSQHSKKPDFAIIKCEKLPNYRVISSAKFSAPTLTDSNVAIKTEPNFNCSTRVGAVNGGTSNDIPKAHIRRFLSTADEYKTQSMRRADKSLPTLKPEKNGKKLRKHKIKIKKECSEETHQSQSGVNRPLDLLQHVLKSKTT